SYHNLSLNPVFLKTFTTNLCNFFLNEGGLIGSSKTSFHKYFMASTYKAGFFFFLFDGSILNIKSSNSLELNGVKTSWPISHSSWLCACQLPVRCSQSKRSYKF